MFHRVSHREFLLHRHQPADPGNNVDASVEHIEHIEHTVMAEEFLRYDLFHVVCMSIRMHGSIIVAISAYFLSAARALGFWIASAFRLLKAILIMKMSILCGYESVPNRQADHNGPQIF